MKKLFVVLRTPEKTYYEGDADKVSLSTEDGSLELYPKHTPLTGAISFSQIEIFEKDHKDTFLVRNGFVFMEPDNHAKILVYTCDPMGSTDTKTIQEYQEFVLSQLNDVSKLTSYQLQYLKEQKIALEKMIEVIHSPQKG